MTRTPPASWAPPAAARPSTAASLGASTSSPARSARPWAARSGGYVAARREVIEWLRQRSRPYLFSNSIPPVVAGASLAVLDLLEDSPQLRAQLFANAQQFRAGLAQLGFDLKAGEHPIIPVMLGDAALAGRMAERLLEEGVYVVGFSYPVVPKGQARIRTQMSAALTREQLTRALAAFHKVGRELGVVN